MLKKVFCLLLIIFLALSASGCSLIVFSVLGAFGNDSESKEDIIAFVEKYQDKLLSCVQREDYSPLDQYSIIKEVNVEEDCIDFYCGGAGMGSETYYCGFFYTATDDMTAVWCAPVLASELESLDEGYIWQSDSDDNQYYTQHICDCFYYYEAYF